MINRQLSRLLLCSILGSTTLISGCALVRKDSAPHQCGVVINSGRS
ncbi:TPA: hypothetical protein OCO50_004098 [Escherichia coli]|nr:hypothetical protein [Escherichia coli]